MHVVVPWAIVEVSRVAVEVVWEILLGVLISESKICIVWIEIELPLQLTIISSVILLCRLLAHQSMDHCRLSLILLHQLIDHGLLIPLDHWRSMIEVCWLRWEAMLTSVALLVHQDWRLCNKTLV